MQRAEQNRQQYLLWSWSRSTW